MILFVNDNTGILFLRRVTEVVGRFLKIVRLVTTEYIQQTITVEDSNGTC